MTRQSDARRNLIKFGSCAHQTYGGCLTCRDRIKGAAQLDILEAENAELTKANAELNERLGLDDEDLMPQSVRVRDEDGVFRLAKRAYEDESTYYQFSTRSAPTNALQQQQKMIARHMRENG